jgi:hypothetical protein
MPRKRPPFRVLLDQYERAERELSRALRKWDKLRLAVRAAEKRLDSDWRTKAAEIGGLVSPSDFVPEADSVSPEVAAAVVNSLARVRRGRGAP